ncbi:Protein ELYS [Trichinella spiralis]|uniref:Protein ELYS n=1 Tax=Trichinella spiralis TaxID=6334 RepID=A0A0V1BWN6_TRISP|nr:Protein ELYS [Trichinella spiralis]
MALGSVKRDKSRHQTKKENRQNTDDKTLKLGQWGFQRVAKSKLTNHIGFPCSLGSSLFWLSWKFSVAIVDTLTSRTVAYWNFPSDSLITVVCPFKFNDSDAGLLVATWNETSKAVLCVFDLMSNRIVRQYNFNQKINCLEIVKDNSLSLERWICRTPPSFHSWQTAVAVGVDEGHVYLIDVCLSSRIEPEKEPNDSTVSALSEDINRTRFVDILAEHHKSNGTFRTQNRYRKVEMLLNEISCTALKFQKQSFILAVGFNFGEFLLFDLTEFMSIYFSNFLKKSIVSGFCFVEPENAIRSTLYCWTFRENLPDRRYRSSMELSKMVFLEKSVDNSETDYQKMCSCNVCFKQTLRKCRKFVSCTHVTSTCTNSNESDSGQLNDSSISCCTYILWLTEKNVVRGHLFDFNAWYRCGMPRRICSGKLSFCPFYTLHIIEPPSKVITANVSRLINGQQNVESRLFSIQLRDIAVRDAVFTEHELCGYACALSATVRVLCKNGMKLYNCQSAPAQAIKDVENMEVTQVLESSEAYCRLYSVGLVTESVDYDHLEKQAAAVWSIMLNERRVIFLMKFLVDVTELQARKQFLEWIWDTCVMIKHELADFCNRHLNIFGFDPYWETLVCLTKYRIILDQLLLLHQMALNSFALGKDGCSELHARQEALTLIAIYVHMIIWFLDHALAVNMTSSHWKCFDIRKAVHKSKQISMHKDGMLLIDMFLNEVEQTVGSGFRGLKYLYSPTLPHLLNIYLFPGVELKIKHAIVFYFMLSCVGCHPPEAQVPSPVNRLVELFNQQLFRSLDSVFADLIQCCWLFDHDNHEKGYAYLRDLALDNSYCFNNKIWNEMLKRFSGDKTTLNRFMDRLRCCKDGHVFETVESRIASELVGQLKNKNSDTVEVFWPRYLQLNSILPQSMDRVERSSFDTSSLNASTSVVDSFPVISSSNDKKWMECVNALKIADAKLQLTLGKQMNIAAKMLPLISNFSTTDRQLEKYHTDCSTTLKDIRKRKWNRATLLPREYFASDVDDDFPPNYKTKKMNEETLCSSTVEDSFVEVSPFTIEASRADIEEKFYFYSSIDLERFQYILDALFLPDSESVVAAETEPKKPRPPILKLSTNSAMKQEKNTTEKSSESVKEVSFEFPAEEEEEVLVEDEEEGREYDENDTSTSDDSYSILSIDDSDINDHPDDESEDGSQPPIQSATVPHEVIRPVEKNDAQDDDLSFEGNESGRWLNNNQPKMLQVVQVEQQVILPRSKSNEKRSEVVIDDRQMELVSQCKVESFTYDASVEDPFISDDEENENDQPSRFVETFVSSVQLKYYSSENPTDQSHLQTMHGDVQSGMISGGLLSDDDEYSAGDEAESERLIRSRRFNPADAAAKEKSSSSAALKYQIFVGGVEMERDFNSPLVGERPPSSVPGDSDEEEEEKKSQAQVYSPPMTRARAKKSEKSKNNPHAAAAADDGN